MKRHRRHDGPDATQEPTPVPAPELCYAALQEFEKALLGTDLVDLRENVLLQWLQAVPSWVEWTVAVADVSRQHYMLHSTAQASPASGMTPMTPLVSTPLSGSIGAFPSAPLRTPYRPRVADSTPSLIALATVLRTVPWRRVSFGRPKAEAIAEAFEAACVSLLQCPGAASILSVPVVEACLAPFCADDEAIFYLGMVAAKIASIDGRDPEGTALSASQSAADAAASQYEGSSASASTAAAELRQRVTEAADWYSETKHGFQDIDRAARIINSAAAHHREKIVEVLQRTVASHFPQPRWPIARHAERYVELLLRLAALPQPPKGFLEPSGRNGSGAVFSISPALSPMPSSTDLTKSDGASPTATSTHRSPKATPAPPPLQPYPIANHMSLLLDMVLSKLVEHDNALTLRDSDVQHIRRLRRLVSHTAKLLQRAYRQRAASLAAEGGGGETEPWVQSLFVFHQQRIMPVSDTKAVHMLVPMLVTVCNEQDKAAFLHGCISFAEKSPAYNVTTKATCVAHLGPLLAMLGGAFARRDPDDPTLPNTADEVLCGMARRLIKMVAKAAKATTTAGCDRFAEAGMAVVAMLSQRFGDFPLVGRGDLTESQVKQLSERAAVPGTLCDIRLSVRRLYDDAIGGASEPDYGEKAMNALKRLATLPCLIEF